MQDSEEDKAAEITKMGDIYSNSELVIAACLSSRANEGCFSSAAPESIGTAIPAIVPDQGNIRLRQAIDNPCHSSLWTA